MGIEGKLDITIEHAGDAPHAVRIASSRPVHASRVLHGKPVSEALAALPLVFSICSTAQACAGVRACERALGVESSAQADGVRTRLVETETLREHLWRILLDWPAFSGALPDKDAMAQAVSIQKQFRAALCPGGDPFQVAGANVEPDRRELAAAGGRLAPLLEQAVFGVRPERWLEIEQADGLMAWAAAREGVAAVMIDEVARAGWAEAGRCAVAPLPELDEAQWRDGMRDEGFIERPSWQGGVRETSPLTRTTSPLLAQLRDVYGNGLLVRLAARLTELARIFARLESGLPGGDAGGGPPAARPADNPGIGQAEAARGRLLHRVALDGGAIADYRILAPTEWNFHPDGVVAQALAALQGDHAEVERQARWLINAIDPCVGYDLVVR